MAIDYSTFTEEEYKSFTYDLYSTFLIDPIYTERWYADHQELFTSGQQSSYIYTMEAETQIVTHTIAGKIFVPYAVGSVRSHLMKGKIT